MSLLASDFGLNLYPWQKMVVGDWCSRDESDKLSYTTCGLSVPRQNGKNAILEAYELYALLVSGWHILHTAHRVKTAKKSFRRLEKYFTDRSHPEVYTKVDTIRRTNGEEAIYLTNGASIEFSARSHAGNRGFDDIQLVVFDEAQDLLDDQLSAIMYTMAASSTGERQMIYTGTPPDDSSPGTVFKRRREAAQNESNKRFCWHEWSIEKKPRDTVTFGELIDLVYQTNPSMGYVLDEEYTEDEFGNATIEGFSIERLGWWKPALTEASCIPQELWESAVIDAIGDHFSSKTTFGIKFDRDGTRYALVGCKVSKKGISALELIEVGDTSAGTNMLAYALAQRSKRASCVVIDGVAGAGVLCENLGRLKAPRGYVIRPRASDIVLSATMLLDGLKEGVVKHTPNDDLDMSALGCIKREVGKYGGWGFGSTKNVDSMAIEAASLALFGARTSKRDPKRKQKLL